MSLKLENSYEDQKDFFENILEDGILITSVLVCSLYKSLSCTGPILDRCLKSWGSESNPGENSYRRC